MIVTIAGRRYRIVEQSVVTTYDRKGQPYRYNAATIVHVKGK